MKRLTKEDILEGTNNRINLYVDEYNAEVVIRPLSDGEVSKILSSLGSVPVNQNGQPEIQKIELEKNFEALRLATATGIVEPKLTMEDVSNMKFGVPQFIGTKILELSGVVSPEEAKKKEER
jgi:hypothetical protein